MRGIQTGTIYFAHKFDAWSQTIECTALHQGKDNSIKIGDRYKYDAFLFEDFDGTLTLSNVG